MSQRIHDLPEHDRPRERLMRDGPAVLSDAELLGIFINTGMKGENAVQIGQRLLATHGGLRKLSRMSPQELAKTKGLGPAKAATLHAAFELGRRAEFESVRETMLSSAADTYRLLSQEMQALGWEEVHILLLNSRNVLIHRERLFKGSLNESICHPREILRTALAHQAKSFILTHNHPSGDPQPSSADRSFTRQVRQAAELMQVPLLDHVIIGHPAEDRPRPYFSFAEAGML